MWYGMSKCIWRDAKLFFFSMGGGQGLCWTFTEITCMPKDNCFALLSVIWGFLHGSAWRRQWHPTPVLLPGKSHGRRSLVGCSPWGREESDRTEWLHFHFSLLCIGEGNGNPLQFFCLENPRDGGAWWAAVHGVTQSRTRLRWLSSSSIVQQWWICLQCRKPGDTGLIPGMGWQPTPLIMPGKSHGQRSLVGNTVQGVAKKVRHD